MIKMLAAAALILVQEPTALPDTYQSVCKSESEIGYNWRNGGYRTAQYDPNTYIITVGDTKHCSANPAKNLDTPKVKWRDVCANITRVGDTPYPDMASHCREEYIIDGTASSVTLNCLNANIGVAVNMAADPSGWFHLTSVHSNTSARPQRDYKDSLVIGVGKCTRTR